jgi:hypothetical protein
MTRDQLEHVLRASAAITTDKSFVEGAIGQLSMFHDTFGYCADGVGPETARMPTDWMKSASLHYIGELTVVVPDLHDIAVSKCVAGRDKDAEWIRGLFRHGMIDPARLESRLRALDVADGPVESWVAWARRRHEEAQA